MFKPLDEVINKRIYMFRQSPNTHEAETKGPYTHTPHPHHSDVYINDSIHFCNKSGMSLLVNYTEGRVPTNQQEVLAAMDVITSDSALCADRKLRLKR